MKEVNISKSCSLRQGHVATTVSEVSRELDTTNSPEDKRKRKKHRRVTERERVKVIATAYKSFEPYLRPVARTEKP